MSGESSKNTNPGFFWHEKRFEPKRTFRWKVRFDNLVPHIPPQYVISAQKPNFGFTVESISDLGTPKYKKGPLELRPIEIVCIDDEQNTVSNWIHYYYHLAGLNFSKYSEIGNTTSRTLTEKTKNIEISMLNELGNVIEQYVLYNGWISDVKYSPLNYTDGGLATYTMIIVYDNYEYLVSEASSGTIQPNMPQRTLLPGVDPDVLASMAGLNGTTGVKQVNANNPVDFLQQDSSKKLADIHGGVHRAAGSGGTNGPQAPDSSAPASTPPAGGARRKPISS